MAHIFNLLGLRVVDVSLTSDAIVALFDFVLSSFKLLGHVALSFLGLRQLNLNIAERYPFNSWRHYWLDEGSHYTAFCTFAEQDRKVTYPSTSTMSLSVHCQTVNITACT